MTLAPCRPPRVAPHKGGHGGRLSLARGKPALRDLKGMLAAPSGSRLRAHADGIRAHMRASAAAGSLARRGGAGVPPLGALFRRARGLRGGAPPSGGRCRGRCCGCGAVGVLRCPPRPRHPPRVLRGSPLPAPLVGFAAHRVGSLRFAARRSSRGGAGEAGFARY